MTKTADAGFTLIEVVVALAIVTLGMLAVFNAVSSVVNNTNYLRDKTFASWIAADRLAEIRVGGEFPSIDETEDDVEFAEAKWKLTIEVSATEVEDLRRVDVRVRREADPEDTSLALLSGFVGAASMAAPPSSTPWNGAGTRNPDGQPASPSPATEPATEPVSEPESGS